MIVDYFLNDTEKKVFQKFFLKDDSEGKTYRTWIDNFLASYGLKIEKDQNKYSDNYQFNLMWDKDTHLLQYILKQEEPLVSSRLRYILKLNSFLDRTDENGNNLLHLSAAKQNHHWLLNFFLEHHSYDTYQTNNNGDTYHTLYVKKFDNNLCTKVPKQNSPDFIHLIQDTHYLFYIVRQFNDESIKNHISKNTFDNFLIKELYPFEPSFSF